jgi:hypothetical protein
MLISVNMGVPPATGYGKAFTRNISKPGDLPAVDCGINHEHWIIAG